MKKMKLFLLTFITSTLLLMAEAKDHMLHPNQQRPLCVSQLALANYACGRLGVAPSGPETPAIETNDQHRRGHRHRHRHRHRQTSHDSPAENCCRWLNDLDDECVCELLVRLPAFLAGPVHQYTVIIGNACRVSYNCNGRGRP